MRFLRTKVALEQTGCEAVSRPDWWHTGKMSVTDTPRALLWPAAMIFWGPQFTCSRHSHHSIQLIVALEGSLRIRSGTGQEWTNCCAVLVRADAPHEVMGGGARSLFVFVDPESDLGTTLSERITASIQPIDARTSELWRNALGDPARLTADRVKAFIASHLLFDRRMPRLHPKVRLVLKVLRNELSADRKFSLKRLADIAGLSPSRFMHVFTESVGVPVRPYILWLRLQWAFNELMNGATVTETAHRAGFADAAHLTRSFRRRMGMTPGRLVEWRLATRPAFADLASSSSQRYMATASG